jgi:hypothetical protein
LEFGVFGRALGFGAWECLGIWCLGVPWNLVFGSALEFGAWECLGIWSLELGI